MIRSIPLRAAVATLLVLALSLPAYATSFQDYQRLKGEGKLEEALGALRKEFADPSFVHSVGAQPVILRQHFLLTLGELAQRTEVKPEFDAEALRIYREGIEKFAGSDGERQAFMNNGLALYYSRSYRNGLALPYYRKELEHWQRANNRFRLILGYDAIGDVYWDTGEVELARLQKAKALEIAAGYFVLGEWPSDTNEWLQYSTILGKGMNIAALTGDHAMLDKLWALQEPIGPRYWRLGSMSYFTAAQRYASSGQIDRARALLAKGRELWAKERGNFSGRIVMLGDVGLLCSDAVIATEAREYAAAAPSLDRCIEETRAAGLKDNEINV